MGIVRPTVAILGCVACSASLADVLDDRWYVSPMYTYTDQNRQSHNGEGGTLAIGKPIGEQFNLEASAFAQHFGARRGTDRADYNEVGVKLNTLWVPHRGKIQPYLNGGIGLVHTERNDPSGREETDAMLEGGGGVMVPLNDHGLGLRAEGMYRFINYDHPAQTPGGPDIDGVDEKMLNVGLYVPIEKRRDAPLARPRPVEEREAMIYDSDGDGVHDKIDACPDTVAGETVDRHGCALRSTPVVTRPAPVAQAPVEYRQEYVETDTDADGVPDRLDACANSNPRAPVDGIGCLPARYRYRR